MNSRRCRFRRVLFWWIVASSILSTMLTPDWPQQLGNALVIAAVLSACAALWWLLTKWYKHHEETIDGAARRWQEESPRVSLVMVLSIGAAVGMAVAALVWYVVLVPKATAGNNSPAPDGLQCFYLAVERYHEGGPTTKIEYSNITFQIDEAVFHFDNNDVTSPKFFVIKGYQRGRYLFKATFPFYGSTAVSRYAAELNLGESQYYLLRWSPSTHVLPDTNHILTAPVSEAEFRAVFRKDLVLPSCAASPRGITQGY